MTISVVIPAYNEEELLPKTLASIRTCTRQPDEILVVNASSTDTTEEKAKAAGARVITVTKRTIGFSRQQGILAATGDVVAFTDADAIIPKDWLNRIEQVLSRPGIDGYFGGFRVIDGPWWYKWYINGIQPLYNMVLYWITKIPMATGQNMAFWRKKAIAAGGIPENFRIAEDIEIARRLQEHGKIFFTQRDYVLASGRRGNEGIGLPLRTAKAFLLYFLFRKADTIGFPDIRTTPTSSTKP